MHGEVLVRRELAQHGDGVDEAVDRGWEARDGGKYCACCGYIRFADLSSIARSISQDF